MRAMITTHHGNFFFETSEYVRITGWYFVTYTVSPLHSAFTRMVSFTRINLTFNLSLDMKIVSKFTLKKVSFVIFLTTKVSIVLTNVVSFRCTYGNLSTNRWCLATGSHENRMKKIREKVFVSFFLVYLIHHIIDGFRLVFFSEKRGWKTSFFILNLLLASSLEEP